MRLGLRRLALAAAAGFAATIAAPAGAFADEAPQANIDKMFDKYWGKKREPRVIEERIYPQAGRHELTLFAGSIPNAPHFLLYPVGGRYNFYFVDWLGLEVAGAYIVKSESDLENFLTVNSLRRMPGTPEHQKWYGSGAVVFSPLHGKIGAFTGKLSHFDMLVALGGAALGLEGAIDGEDKSATKFGGVGGVGFRFFMNPHMALRLDYRHFFHPALDGTWSFPAEFTLGLNFFAGG